MNNSIVTAGHCHYYLSFHRCNQSLQKRFGTSLAIATTKLLERQIMETGYSIDHFQAYLKSQIQALLPQHSNAGDGVKVKEHSTQRKDTAIRMGGGSGGGEVGGQVSHWQLGGRVRR